MPLFHGSRPILGYRLGTFAYLTDCNRLPDEAWPLLDGLDVLVLDALRHRPHPTHFTVAEALAVVERVKPRQTYFTHMCHDLPHAATNASLPAGVELAYDGLVVTIDVGRPEDAVDVIHFPDDPRPLTWRSPVLALGNFDGLHRGHVKIVERIQRGALERGGTSVVLTFDPHPPRVLRPDKAPALLMTKAQKLDALARAGVQGAAVVRFTPRDVAVGARGVRAHGAGGVAARRRGVGRRRLPVRPQPQRQLHAAASRSARSTASAPRRSIPSATRTSSSRARASAGW